MTPIPGTRNGYIVDDFVCRGAQPTDGEWHIIRTICRAVIDLNNTNPVDIARQHELVTSVGMTYHSMPWNGLLPPSQAEINSAITVIGQHIKSRTYPVFIHCEHGSDRTGTLCACWRIYHDHYSLGHAIKEAFFDLGFQGEHDLAMLPSVFSYWCEQRNKQ